MKNRHWLEFTEYASIAGVATGAVASFVAKQALYLSTPLSVALLVGFANRRRVERVNEEKAATSIATLKRKLSKQIKLMDQHIQTLPTPEMVGDVRNSTLRHSRDELKQLTAKIQSMQEDMGQYSILLDEQNFGGVRDEIRQLQGFYTEVYGSLKRLQQTLDDLDVDNKKKAIETLVSQLRSESEQLQSRFQSLTDQTQPILSYLQEQVNHLNRQNSTILQQVDSNSLKRELDILMDAVADLAPKRDLNSVMSDIRALQEHQDLQGQADEALQKQLTTVMQRLQAVPDVPQFRAQIEETLSWKLRDINKQLRTLPNTDQFELRVKETLRHELDRVNHQLEQRSDQPPYKLIFELQAHSQGPQAKDSESPYSGSRQILEEALSSAKQRLIMVWPWSLDMHMDRSLMQKLEWFVKQGRQLDIGWCHINSAEEDRFLSVINRRWNFDPLHRRSMQRTLQYLLALKRRYPDNFKFRVLGTIENFLVADQSFAVLGIEDRLTPISSIKDISLKLWTRDTAVIQQLIQTFDHTEIVPEDIESHWNRAMTRYDLGDRAGAIADVNQVLSIQPNHAAACNMRGIIHFDQGDVELALADFDRSLDIDQNQTTVYCNRGFIRSEQGDQYSAIADFSLALQAETSKAMRFTNGSNRDQSALPPTPKLGIAYFYRGLACQKLDDFEGAITDYTEALNHVEESPVIRYHRGITYQAIANYDGAIVDLESAVTLFKAQGSKTNTRRASRHLAQARKALVVNESTRPLSQSIESESLAPGSTPELSRPSPPSVPNPFSLPSSDLKSSAPAESLPNPFATPVPRESVPQESSAPAEPLSNPFANDAPEEGIRPLNRQLQPLESLENNPEPDPDLSSEESFHSSPVSIPKFLFPDANRSRPSMIQDLDSEILDDATVNESEGLAYASRADLNPGHNIHQTTVKANGDSASFSDAMAMFDESEELNHSTQENTNAPPTSNESWTNAQPIRQERRRQRPDLDKLVTSTLTNFFDEVDMEQLGTQTLDNFFAVVQDEAMSDVEMPDALAADPMEDGAPEALNLNPDDGQTAAEIPETPPVPSLASSTQGSADGDEADLEKLVTSTLTNFFKDLSQDDFNAAPPDFLEAVSHQDISEQTLIHFHDVVDEPSDALQLEDVERKAEEEETVSEKRDLQEAMADDASLSLAQDEPLLSLGGEEDAEETDTNGFAETPSPDAESLRPDAETPGTNRLSDGLTDELGLIDPSQSVPSMDTFFGETTSESVGEGTLIHFRNVVEDDIDQSSNVDGHSSSPASSPTVSSPAPSNDVPEAVSTDNTQSFGNFMTIFEEANSEITSNSTPNNGTSDNSTLNPSEENANGLPVGTETLSNLMAVIAEEELGTQTLRDFVNIMGQEKARAFPGVEVAEWDTSGTTDAMPENSESGAEQGTLLSDVVATDPDSEAEHQQEPLLENSAIDGLNGDALAESQPSSDSATDNGAEDKRQDDSTSFESLADFSDRF